MRKFTFIFEYQKGTYIKQIHSLTLAEAIIRWSKEIGPEIPNFSIEDKSQLLNEVEIEDPIPLEGIENVWSLSLRIRKPLHLLNIVETV